MIFAFNKKIYIMYLVQRFLYYNLPLRLSLYKNRDIYMSKQIDRYRDR